MLEQTESAEADIARDDYFNHHTVTKSNDLIEAGYSLTLNEQRLLLVAISKIDPRKPMSQGNPG